MNENTRLKDSLNGLVNIDTNIIADQWELVKDAVDYPVWITPAYYKDEDEDRFANANGETNTGRDKIFNLVVVDKFRDGDKQCISTVTDTYGSVSTKDVYEQFETELTLSEISHTIKNLFVTGNGGMQQLTVEMNDMIDLQGCPDNLVMRVVLETSVDGSKAHKLSMRVHNKTSKVDMHVYGGDYNLNARHTNTIAERVNQYIPTLNRMIENWNDVIIPTMSLMFDEKFDREFALNMIEDICKKAQIGERHQKNLRDLYSGGAVKTLDNTDSLYRVNAVFNQYFEENLDEKRELQNKFKDGVARAVNGQLIALQKLKK
jgi:hypothetical protein